MWDMRLRVVSHWVVEDKQKGHLHHPAGQVQGETKNLAPKMGGTRVGCHPVFAWVGY